MRKLHHITLYYVTRMKCDVMQCGEMLYNVMSLKATCNNAKLLYNLM